MTKGNYKVNDPAAAEIAQADTSFRNCVCAMLVFISMCVIIIVVAIVFRGTGSEQGPLTEDNRAGEESKLYGNGVRTTTTPPSTISTSTPPTTPSTTTTTAGDKETSTTTTSTPTTTISTSTSTENVVKVSTVPQTTTTTITPAGDKETSATTSASTTNVSISTSTVSIAKVPTTPSTTTTTVTPPGDKDISTTTASAPTTTISTSTSSAKVPLAPTDDTNKKTTDTTKLSNESGSATTEYIKQNKSSYRTPYMAVPYDEETSTIQEVIKVTETTDTTKLSNESGSTTTEYIKHNKSSYRTPYMAVPYDEETSTIQEVIKVTETTDTTKLSNESGSTTAEYIQQNKSSYRTPYMAVPYDEETSTIQEEVTTVTAFLVSFGGANESTTLAHSTEALSKEKSTEEMIITTAASIGDEGSTTLTNLVGNFSEEHSTEEVTTATGITVSSSGDEKSTTLTNSAGNFSEEQSTEELTIVTKFSASSSGDEESTNLINLSENFSEEQSTEVETTVTAPSSSDEESTALINSAENFSEEESTEEITTSAALASSGSDNEPDAISSTEQFTSTTPTLFDGFSKGSTSTEQPSFPLSEAQDDDEYSSSDVSSSWKDNATAALTTHIDNNNVTIEKTETTTANVIIDSQGSSNNKNKSLASGDLTKTVRSPSTGDSINETICNTKTCKSTTSRMLSLMNHSAEECDNFYEYSCGGFTTDEEYEYLARVWSQFQKLMSDGEASPSSTYFDHFKKFYDSCVSHENEFDYSSRVEAVKGIVKNVGDIILDKRQVVEKMKLTVLLAKLVLIKSLPIMEVNTVVDSRSSEYVFQITLPDKNLKDNPLHDWSTWLVDEQRCVSQKYQNGTGSLDLAQVYDSVLNCRKEHTSYMAAVNNAIRELNFYSNLTTSNAEDKLNENLKDIVDILQLLHNVTGADIRNVTLNEHYNEVNITTLQTNWDVIYWKEFFEELVGGVLSENTTVHVYLYNEINTVMRRFSDMVTGGRSSALYNMLLTIYATDIYQNTVIPKHKENRGEYCLELSTYLFNDISSYLYMDKMIDSNVIKYRKAKITDIFSILKNNFIDAIKTSQLFENPDTIVEKAERLQTHFPSHLEECLIDTNLIKKYKNTNNITDGFFGQHLVWSMEFNRRNLFSLVGHAFHEKDMFCYFLRPYDVKPKSFYAKEIIAVPYGIFRNIPADVPGYVLMARIGIHLAQEIGIHFNPVGLNHNTKLTDNDDTNLKDIFQEMPFHRIRVINDQSVTFVKRNLTTITEVADNMGLGMVSHTYEELPNNYNLPWINDSFTQEQIFYVSVAQEFCEKVDTVDYMLHIFERGLLPAQMRVEIMLVNSKEFINAFECSDGLTMTSGEVIKKQFPHGEIYE